ncbi:TRAP transporter large permease subunit [Rhizobium sp. BK376]|uniref:TRAP transporter large permease n=1 Tax=Rhizobium sp. BK376 TaxID=2512149 RepID=UPI001048B7B8|nr:TRAP transporter large permease subunit [Rhizobium sp. BK376]TCR74810.1 tripartite ATP-independent transporter DctM subunit [Rhizobium sp. BK376]
MAGARTLSGKTIEKRADEDRKTGILTVVDEFFVAAISAVAALLLAIEIVVLFLGIVARYVFHHPLVWTDEFDSILFLWLGMLGAAIALRRWEHMRMTTFVSMLPASWQSYLSGFALAVVIAFLLLLLPPSFEHVQTEAGVISPSLEISMFWRAVAMPVGIGLMIVSAILRFRTMPRMVAVVSVVAVVIAASVLAFLQPFFLDLDQANLAIFFLVGVPLMVFSGIPIAFAFSTATFAYLTLGTYVPPSILVARLDAGMSQLLLLAIPTFVFLGLLIEMTGMAERMIIFLSNLLGHVRGGLQYVLIAAMYLVSGISGSKAADMAAIAPALFPEMEKLGNDRDAMTALLAATGAQTETVPPSLILIAVGSVTGLSIAGLFTAGLLPSALLGVMLCIFVWFRTRKAPKAKGPAVKRSLMWKSFVVALPALALPFVIRSAVVEGVATATEVSTVGIVYALIVGLLLYRQFEWKRLIPMLAATASLSGAILFVTGAATAMAWAITQSGFSQTLADAIAAVPGGVPTFMALSILLFAILGSVLEGLPAIVLFGPLMFPIAQGLGINDIYYAIVAILAMSLGLFTPPFGVGFYITCAIGGADPNRAMRHLWPYLAILTIGVVIIALVPWLSIGLIQ